VVPIVYKALGRGDSLKHGRGRTRNSAADDKDSFATIIVVDAQIRQPGVSLGDVTDRVVEGTRKLAGAGTKRMSRVTRKFPMPVTVTPSAATVVQVPPPVTSSSPTVKVPKPVTVISDPSWASADAVPPALTVGTPFDKLRWGMSHRYLDSP